MTDSEHHNTQADEAVAEEIDVPAPATGSDDDDYIVQLRAPRPLKSSKKSREAREKKAKRKQRFFQLYLSQDDASSSEDIAVPQPSVSENDEPCSRDNWKTFFSYRTQPYIGGNHASTTVDAGKFDSKRQKGTKSLILTMTMDKKIHLSIESPYLQKQFRRFVAIQNYHSVVLSASRIIISSPFAPLFHNIEDINKYVMEDSTATAQDRREMDALYYFATLGSPAGKFGDARAMLSEGLIIYENLWALYTPGALVVTKDPIGHISLSKIISVKLKQTHVYGNSVKEFTWSVIVEQCTCKSEEFRKMRSDRLITIFSDASKITDLSVYPLDFHPEKEAVLEAALTRGRAWKEFIKSEPRVMDFEGEALPLVLNSLPPNSRNSLPSKENSEEPDAKTLKLMSTVIVDPKADSKAMAQASLDFKKRLWHHSFHDGGVVDREQLQELSEEDLLICPASISVVSLDDHQWYSVDVGKLKEKQWKPKAFDRLVLDKAKKDTLIRLASTNSRLIQSFKSKDVIDGKGKGLIMLLHGPPGVGKTLTAELLSEHTKRPLLKVNLGRIASHRLWEQTLEQIFSNAEDWKAILLIDEAEIVLEKRTFERMTQNSWISVFLRKLEYYQGILILTTNLIDCIDEAFESRISYPIHFSELSVTDRHQIWTDFIKAMEMLPTYKTALLNEVDRWSEAEINGRQIRNVILMAENLAASDEKRTRLMPCHVDELLNVTLEFCAFNRENPARMKKLQLSGPSY